MPNAVVPFVVGCQRSGTSLLTVLLDRHSRLAMLPETHLLNRTLWERPGWPIGPTHEHLLLAAWQRAWFRLRDLYFEPRRIRERMVLHPCTPEGLLTTLLDLWAEQAGKPFAGEKTPQHIEVVDRILTGIPGAKVTVNMRDGRAVVQSRHRGGAGHPVIDDLVDHWVATARLTDHWLAIYPERVRLTSFEALTSGAEAALVPLMQWFGLEFEPAQLSPGPSSTFRRWEDRFKRDAEGPIDTARKEAWRSGETLLSAEQLGRMAPWLARFGYPEPTRSLAPVHRPVEIQAGETHRHRSRQQPAPLLLIGAQRAGATTLASWLATDPAIVLADEKQASPLATQWPVERGHFFDLLAPERCAGERYMVDLAPYYLLHPDLPRRARATVPDARIVVLLRDPVARAYSHWLNEWRMGAEPLPFAEALAQETSRLGDAGERLQRDPAAVSFDHVHYSYALRGGYHTQLARWYDVYPSAQILVLTFEELVADPATAWPRLRAFLSLEAREVPALPHKNGLRWPVTRNNLLRSPEARRLRSQLSPEILALERLLGRPLPWAEPADAPTGFPA